MTTEKKSQAVYVSGAEIVAPGFSDQQQTRSILTGKRIWQSAELEKLNPVCLPPNERRRTTALIKLAIQVALQTVEQQQNKSPNIVLQTQDSTSTLISPATVFASSDGDFSIVDKLCEALSEDEKNVSPTQFHNSVHNAPAGYWAIAAKCSLPSTSISAGDFSFASGLLEAITQVQANQQPVLFIGYDYPAPQPLDEKRHFEFPFSIGLFLSATKQENSLAELKYKEISRTRSSLCKAEELAAIQNGNPMANALPLVESIFRRESQNIYLPYFDQQSLCIEVSTC